MAPDMVSMPTNRMPKPMSTSPKARAVGCFLGRMLSARPRQAKIMPKSSFTESIREVTVVPMLAPMMTPTAWVRDSSPAFTKPTTITVVAEEDWITAVMPMPASTASTRLWVTIFRMFFRRFPAVRSSPSPIIFIPNRNRLRPPSRLNTFITDMRFPPAHSSSSHFKPNTLRLA